MVYKRREHTIDYTEEYAKVNRTRINKAWKALHMPKLTPSLIAYEHDQWWVIGYDKEGDRVTYSVELAEGPGSANGLIFEEC